MKVFGHSVHQMLIVFPMGLLPTAILFDAITYFFGNPKWTEMAFYLIGAGVLTGLIAAVFGALDYSWIRAGTRAKRIGMVHGVGNVVVVLLFATSFWLRWDSPPNAGAVAYLCSCAGGALVLVTGWLGGELVNRLGVGVDNGANLNAPSSLSSPTIRRAA